MRADEPGTFSIVARSEPEDSWGVAVATKPMSVGAAVPWAAWRVGAIATQADTNYTYGPKGLDLLRDGVPAPVVLERLTRADPGRDRRQLAVVDARGRVAAWTGAECLEWAGHQTGDGYSVQGNLLANGRVVPAMARAFERTRGSLGRRLVAALRAGRAAGGDRRGTESSAMVVVHRERWFQPSWSDRWVDLRVDHSSRPVPELARLFRRDEAATRKFLATRAAAARRRKK